METCLDVHVINRPCYLNMQAIKYIRQIAQEMSGEIVYGLGRQPAVLRTFSQRLSR